LLHLLVVHRQDAQIRPGYLQKAKGPSDECPEYIRAKGCRPQVLPDADPVPGDFPSHRVLLARVVGYSTRAWETAESTLLNALPTEERSRSVMSHSSSWPSR